MWLRCVRWFLVVLGGVLLGAGLVLHGQVAAAHYLRTKVESTFVLWRKIGEATYWLQGDDVKLALAVAEVPEEALVASDRAAWSLLLVGFLVTLVGPLLPLRKRAGKPPRSR